MQKNLFTIDEIKSKLEYYCAYQDRCHKEVEKKLQEYRLIPEAREIILLHLMEHKFLDEERFAKNFARGKFRIKNWGKKRIIRELQQRDISTYNIKQALKEINSNEYIETIFKIAEAKNNFIRETNNYNRKQKLYEYLYRKGFENELIVKTIHQILEI